MRPFSRESTEEGRGLRSFVLIKAKIIDPQYTTTTNNGRETKYMIYEICEIYEVYIS